MWKLTCNAMPLRSCEHVSCDLLDLPERGCPENIAHIAHGCAEDLGDNGLVHEFSRECGHHMFVAVGVVSALSSTEEGSVVLPIKGRRSVVGPGGDPCPFGVEIDVRGEVVQVEKHAARGADVDFEGQEAFIVPGSEEFNVKEPLLQTEGGDDPAPGILEVGFQLPDGVEEDVQALSAHLHHAVRVAHGRGKNNPAISVCQTVEGHEGAAHELFHEHGRRLRTGEKVLQILIIGDLLHAIRANAPVGFQYDRVARLDGEGPGLLEGSDEPPLGHGDPFAKEYLLHLRLGLHRGEIGCLQARDGEGLPESGITLKPKLVV